MNPTDDDYFGKILNTDPDRFVTDQHLLYAEYPVDDEIATATQVAIVSGTVNTSENSGEPSTSFREAFGGYDTRYRTPTHIATFLSSDIAVAFIFSLSTVREAASQRYGACTVG